MKPELILSIPEVPYGEEGRMQKPIGVIDKISDSVGDGEE